MQILSQPLTDDELRAAPPHIRAWYFRVLTLMTSHGAAFDLAAAAVADADAQIAATEEERDEQ